MTDRSTHIEDYVQTNRNLEKMWFPRVQKAIKSKVSSLISKVKEDGVQAGVRYLHTDIGNGKLHEVIHDLYREVGLKYAKKNETRLRQSIKKSWTPEMEEKRFGFAQAWVEFIQNYLKLFLLDKITFAVNHTTRDKLLAVMNEAIEKGWGVTEIVSKLETLPFTAHQAARIVRTEINRAANVGVQAQGETFEYELLKEWIAVKDFRTRGVSPEDHADHFHLDGQTVSFKGKFIDPRNGHELTHPGDPKAKAEDTINCRCNQATKAKRDENGDLILRQGKAHLPEMETKEEKMNKEALVKMDSMERGLEEVKAMLTANGSRVPEIKVQLDSIHVQEAATKHLEKRFDERFDQVKSELGGGLVSVKEMIEVKSQEITDMLDYSKRAYAGMVNKMKEEVFALLQGITDVSKEDLKQVIDLINSKEYNPEIKVEANTGEILRTMILIRDDLENQMGKGFNEIMAELIKKHKWQLTVQRNSDKLITGAVATEI